MLCPKCHRPTDDAEGDYICCAGETLLWRCSGCAKMSEGFALPFGACPYCGARLEMATPRKIDDPSALAGIRTAFEIELGGQAFYRRAAAETTDHDLRDLFARFAAMEAEHLETLARRYHTAAPASGLGLPLDLAAAYAGIKGRPSDPETLFRIAVTLEQRAAAFFEQCAAKASAGSVECELYRELAAEEREHAEQLATDYQRLQSGKAELL
jgi:glutamate synthase (NADPH/NADH) small chain